MTDPFRCVGCGGRQFNRLNVVSARRCRCGMYYDKYQRVLWETKSGRSIPVVEMETSHINNSLAMILTRPDWRQGYAKVLIEELERRKLKAGVFQ